jgi:hypothetical protein
MVFRDNGTSTVRHSLYIKILVSDSSVLTNLANRSFLNLSPRTRLAVGASFLVWGTIGLYITDTAEKKLGFEASPGDRERLDGVMPRISVVERTERG